MAMPTMPGAGLIVIKTELVLGGFEAVLNGPAMAFDRRQLLDRGALGAPCREKSQAVVGHVAADQKTARPFPGKLVVVLAGVEIGQFEIGPIVQPWSFGPFARLQAPPSLLGKALRDRSGRTGNDLLLGPRVEHVIGSHTQNITFA